jgi:hypothetical protein
MSHKDAKRTRRTVKKFNKDIFYQHIIEISAMPFFVRLLYCLKMAFKLHQLQIDLKGKISEHRKAVKDAQRKEKAAKRAAKRKSKAEARTKKAKAKG